jgi:putative phage-type endonuclease
MLTEAQRIARKQHLGASDVAALFGLDPFKTATDVWFSKAFELTVTEPSQQSDAIEMGNDFEAPLLGFAARELNVQISTEPDDLFAICEDHPIFAATLDARIMPKTIKEAIEAKTTSSASEYGEEGGDQVPDRVNIQVQAQMLAHNLDRVHVVALIGRMGLKRQLFKVNRNEKIIAAIIEKGEAFWRDYVETKITPPEGEFGLGSIDIIKRVIRQPTTWAEVDEALILDWDTKRKAKLEAEKAEEFAQERMLTPLKDAEGVHLSDGRTLEYLPTTKSILDQKRLKIEQPGLYEQYLRDSVSRTPRLKGGIG